MRVLIIFALVLAGCGGNVATQEPDAAVATPELTASPTREPTPTPTPDERAAYRAEVCGVIDPLVMAVGEQMAPALDAVFDEDPQAAARERTKLDLLIGDLLAALETGPDYAGARTMETRLEAGIDAFQNGLDAAEEGAFEEATGFFEVGLELFNDAKSEFVEVC